MDLPDMRERHEMEFDDATLRGKLDALRCRLRDLGRVAVAFSAGVDSALLLQVAHDELGDDALAVTACSPSIPAREVDEARDFCRERGIHHVVVETHEFDLEGFDRNPPDRCYMCKREILARIGAAARSHGFDVLVEGSNLDDEGDFRPGARAVAEAGVASPLRDAGLTKADVRVLGRRLGVPQWDKPAFACLNTRFAFGDRITPERLAQVDAAEEALRALGFPHVRVRMQDATARIEVPASEITRLAQTDVRERAVAQLTALGFTYVTVDLQGYRMGSMNGTLGARQVR